MIVDKLHRTLIAACIRVGKEPTKENILKYALKWYLTKGYGRCGLCWTIEDSIRMLLDVSYDEATTIRNVEFELFNRGTAKHFCAHPFHSYWWKLNDWKSRYRYMRWLIKQYK